MASWAEDVWTEVATAEEFQQAITASTKAYIRLTADIDVTGLNFSEFKGKISGENANGTDYALYWGDPETKPEDQIDLCLFDYAEGATFSHLVVKNFKHVAEDYTYMYGTLAKKAHQTMFSHISIQHCVLQCGTASLFCKVGTIVGWGQESTYEYCSVDSSSSVSATSEAGGIAGYCFASNVFRFCSNAATIRSFGNSAGGILGWGTDNNIKTTYSPTIENCLNTGHIFGNIYTGGIAGYLCGRIYYCVNTGVIDPAHDDCDTRIIQRGGIVGYLIESASEVDYCLNFGSVNWVKDGIDPIIGESKYAKVGTDNYYFCQYNGNHTYVAGDENNAIFNTIATGEFVTTHLNGAGEKYLYFSIDNGKGDFGALYADRYPVPVPLPEAGEVFKNVLCDGNNTVTYSNLYQGTEGHTTTVPEDDIVGQCCLCGTLATPNSNIFINNADDLCKLSEGCQRGQDYDRCSIYLDSDIDMSGVSDFTPIGAFPSNGAVSKPFKGYFYGDNHRIKNLTVNRNDGKEVGLFGCVSGTSYIVNVIVDSSCQFTGTGYGTAGIIGCLALPSEQSSEKISLTMIGCGNEATINGNVNAAGLIGGVYNTDTNGNADVNIYGCYNSGNITGNEMSAALIAYGNKNVKIMSCYNTGTVSGYDTDHALIRCKSYDASLLKVTDVYNLSTVANDVKATNATAQDFAVGKVYNDLSTKMFSDLWGQNLGTDLRPVFAEGGLHHTRTMAGQWGTFVLPYDVAIDKKKPYEFYTIAGISGSNLRLQKITTTIPAGTPTIIRMKTSAKDAETGNYTFTLKPANTTFSTEIHNPAAVGGLTLNGVYSETNYSDGYCLVDDKFQQVAEVTALAPFNANLIGSLDDVSSLSLVYPGDINENGVITIVDLSRLVDLLNKGGVIVNPAADVDGENGVTKDDVDALREIILTK